MRPCFTPIKFCTTKEERIQLFVRALNFELQVSSVHVTSRGRVSMRMIGYVKKVEG